MRFQPALQEARLLRRYQRFFADVQTDEGERLSIHCPNTGSMRNCMSPGCRVWFSRSTDARRKLPGTWELVETPQGRFACVNTSRANGLVEEALRGGTIRELRGFDALRREVPYGEENSRADFRLLFAAEPVFVEVKSVTLGFADSAVAAFPDAPTVRGVKHLRELTRLAQQGRRAVLLYVVNLSGIQAVRVAEEIDPAYAAALGEAKAAGVQVLAYATQIGLQEICLGASLAVL